MKLEKSKNAGKNMTLELIQRSYGIIVPFVQRTLMIMYLGIEYAGLGGLFASLLSILSLAELGVASAMMYSMYKPIAEDDEDKVRKILNLYKKYYRIIGSVIFAIGLIITPFLKYLIKDEAYPKDLNIYILFLMTLMSTVLTYWLFAYKISVFEAHQKNYIGTRVSMEVSVVFDVAQIIVLVVFRNYYLYLLCSIVRIVVTNIAVALKANKCYPQYKKPKGKLEKQEEKTIRRSVKDIFLNKIGEVLTDSFDSVVTSVFLGLTILAQYQNYLYIWKAVMGVTGVIYNATRAGIGNSLVNEKKSKIYDDLKTFSFIVFWIIALMVAGLLNLYQPFIKLWVGSDNLLSKGIVVCLCLFAALRFYSYMLTTYKSASGMWHVDRFRPLISGIVNLILNLITVQFWGLYGVILSTVICLAVIDIPWLAINIFKTVFREYSIVEYLKTCIKYIAISFAGIATAFFSCHFIKLDGVLEIVIKLVLVFVVCNSSMIIFSFRLKEFQRSISIIKNIIKK